MLEEIKSTLSNIFLSGRTWFIIILVVVFVT